MGDARELADQLDILIRKYAAERGKLTESSKP
jgi:hypothetical protein